MKRRGMDNVRRPRSQRRRDLRVALAIVMGVIPGACFRKTPAGPASCRSTAAHARGRDVYVGEGCSYCHTQQVRPLAQDRVWGRASAAATTRTPRRSYSAPSAPDPT